MMGSKLQRIESGLPIRRTDASTDSFVKEHMAKGELVVCANKYTQSAATSLVQVAVGAVPLGAVGVMAGSIASGLMVGAVAAATLGVLTVCLESTNRLVITERELVVQTSVLLGRFERDRIVNARVESLSFAQWSRLDTYLLDPRYFFKKSPGLRFQYCKPKGKTSEVFVGSGDAYELLDQLS